MEKGHGLSLGESSRHRTYDAATHRRQESEGDMTTKVGDTDFESFMHGPVITDNAGRLGPLHETYPGSPLYEGYQTVAEQEAVDGMDVIALLTAPVDDGVGSTMFPPPEHRLTSTIEAPGGELSDPGVPLDFEPDFLGDSCQAFGTSGTVDPAAARATWLAYWGDVLNWYNEGVWGYLEPWFQAGGSNVSSRSGSANRQLTTTPLESRAVQRLRSLLAHLRRP